MEKYLQTKGIGQQLLEMPFMNGIQLMTNLKKNMKGSGMSYADKILLRKRSVIETMNDEWKNICPIEHARHRSVANLLTNLLAGCAVYSFSPKKPSIKVTFESHTNQWALFL